MKERFICEANLSTALRVSFRDQFFMRLYAFNGEINNNKKASEVTQRLSLCGAEDDLNEPFLRLLMLVRAVKEGDILEKEVEDEIDSPIHSTQLLSFSIYRAKTRFTRLSQMLLYFQIPPIYQLAHFLCHNRLASPARTLPNCQRRYLNVEQYLP